jgi:amino acid transporter
MLNRVKYFLIGAPLPTQKLSETRLNKIRALAAFSPDALSSIAYANQEIYLGLIIAGSAGLALSLPIGIAITILLIIVALSYFQTIHAYPSGGGSFSVARQNLGTLPGLVTASALLIGYLLTAAVSLSAGMEAIASAIPALWEYRVLLAIIALTIITIINLRGISESGTMMAVPVYLFLISYFLMIIYGVIQIILGKVTLSAIAAPPAIKPLTPFLILHTFSAGCTALTGIEAISNGVPYFQKPESKNAGQTLIVMALLMSGLFVGSIGLTQILGVVAGPQETILSALARRLLAQSPFYYLIQITTMLILTVAANTSFAGFPRLGAILAGEGFLPRQFNNLGDRLVYQNGIIALAVATGLLIILFGGDTHALVPLFAVGVFLAFTLSQAGMVLHWIRSREKRWGIKAIINGMGALATGIATIIIGVSKFTEGAWISILLIPILVTLFFRIRSHYQMVGKQLSLRGLPPSLRPLPPARIVVPISGVNRSVVQAVTYALSLSNEVTAVYVELEPGAGEKVKGEWERWFPDVKLVIKPSPFRSIVQPILDYLDETDKENNDGQLAALVLAEYIPPKFWQGLLHNQTALVLRTALLYNRRHRGYQRIIIDTPYHAET